MLNLANAVLAKLRQLLSQTRAFIAFDVDQEADSLMLACGRFAAEGTAVFIHSIDADLRGMQGFTGTRAHFAGIVSLLPGFPSHLWEGNAIIKALNCSPKVLRTVYALMGDNASHSLKGVR